ncbi:MAG: hypothetical protein WHU10_03375 [Fimbriimonadales bacterium]
MPSSKPSRLLWVATAAAVPVALLAARGTIVRRRPSSDRVKNTARLALWVSPCGRSSGQ